ncbi:hypothetical protein CcaverHIS002_0211380 [Cutaneotrichosporon cavernicola]|nr:hypothetical protein CcaverHIS002_0211380 [Cutaneotrichosporon cavernicola]
MATPFHRVNGALFVEGVSATALAGAYGTPLYVYSRAALEAAYHAYVGGGPIKVHVAVKANSNIGVLGLFAKLGAGFDIVSGGELQRVLAAGGRARDVVFSGVGKSVAEMRMGIDVGVKCFNVESIPELERLNEIAGQMGAVAPISLRVNPDVDPKTHPYISTGLKDNKFGVAFEDALPTYRAAAGMKNLRVMGIDCHIGSQITSVEPYLDALDKVLDLVDEVEGAGIEIHHLDVGGGLGIDYGNGDVPPDRTEFVRAILAHIEKRKAPRKREVWFEPGRSLLGDAGIMLTTVEFLKPGAAKNFCIIDAGMNDLARPSMYQAYHAVETVEQPQGKSRTWDVVGPVCESGCWIGRDRELLLRQGDVLALQWQHSILQSSRFIAPPYPGDGVYTKTLDDQRDTEDAIVDVVDRQSPADVPRAGLQDATTILRSPEHVRFLGSTLFSLPAAYVALDASKPWLIFWTVHSYDVLGVLLPQEIKNRATNTLLHFLHPSGGFSGGAANSHIPHLLPTYAAVISLSLFRQSIYDFFMRCKRPDGSFVVCQGGEVDVRGTYCLLVVATLLDIITPELLHNVDKVIAAGQTYEGGFACSSFSFQDDQRVAMAEAHGGYTSCSIFSHFLLASVQPPKRLESLPESFPVPIDVDSALRWSALMQGEAIEAGGFRGRTNKLVDGCYSWWVGGTFPILEELHRREAEVKGAANGSTSGKIVPVDDDDKDEWTDEPSIHALFNRGPSPPIKPTTPGGGWKSEDERQAMRREVWANVRAWVEDESASLTVGGQQSCVNTTIPPFNMLDIRLQAFIDHFYGQ